MQPNQQPVPVNPVQVPNTTPQIPGVTQLPTGAVIVQPNTVAQDVRKAVTTIKDHYASPAFWYHALLQSLVWVSYFQTASTVVKIGSLGTSLLGFMSYLVHLVKA